MVRENTIYFAETKNKWCLLFFCMGKYIYIEEIVKRWEKSGDEIHLICIFVKKMVRVCKRYILFAKMYGKCNELFEVPIFLQKCRVNVVNRLGIHFFCKIAGKKVAPSMEQRDSGHRRGAAASEEADR